MSIVVDTKQIDRLTIELKGFEKEVGESTYHALNRTIDQVITQVGRIVTKEYAIKTKDVKDSFNKGIKRPSKKNLNASLTSRGHTLSLAHFPHAPKIPPQSRRKYQVKVTIKRSTGRQTLKINPKAFIASTGAIDSSKTLYNIFRREGEKRLPITVIRTLSIPQMITNEEVSEQIQTFAQEKLEERLEHEIEYRMTSMSKRIKK